MLSYSFDWVFEMFFLSQKVNEFEESTMIILAEVYHICDPIPIFALLLFHWKNFRIVSVKLPQISTTMSDDKNY